MKLKNIIYIAITAGSFLLIGFVLMNNKKAIENEAELANKVTEAFPVETEKVELDEFHSGFSSSGYLIPSKELIVTGATQGKIESKKITAGDNVNKNDLLVQVENDMFRADFITAETAYKKAQLDEERFKKLFEANAVSKRQFEQAGLNVKNAQAKYIAAKKRFEDSSIKAPFSGYINSVFIEEGQFINGGSKICELIDNNKLKMIVKLSANETARLKNIQSIEVFPEIKDVVRRVAKINFISEKADAAQKFIVELEIENPKRELKAGIFSEVNFNFTSDQNIVVVSRNALIGSTRDAEVYVNKNGIAIKRNVIVGRQYNGSVEILEGLNPGEEVIVTGHINISHGSKIKIVKMN